MSRCRHGVTIKLAPLMFRTRIAQPQFKNIKINKNQPINKDNYEIKQNKKVKKQDLQKKNYDTNCKQNLPCETYKLLKLDIHVYANLTVDQQLKWAKRRGKKD